MKITKIENVFAWHDCDNCDKPIKKYIKFSLTKQNYWLCLKCFSKLKKLISKGGEKL